MTPFLAVLIGLIVVNLLGVIVWTACNSVVVMPGHETTLPPLDGEAVL